MIQSKPSDKRQPKIEVVIIMSFVHYVTENVVKPTNASPIRSARMKLQGTLCTQKTPFPSVMMHTLCSKNNQTPKQKTESHNINTNEHVETDTVAPEPTPYHLAMLSPYGEPSPFGRLHSAQGLSSRDEGAPDKRGV
ncbi:hypothetical protein IAQ61_009519 [Plenodomus lingam]|uniref:uncharacterized protein n=1 Tax=Leptosphaeria maculans TaxID=5022 RepID=UPI00333028F2|nr:hypothetical protein IAQ61_009519 [Plenodomus lingam]